MKKAEKAIKSMKNGKTLGPGGLYLELCKYDGVKIRKVVTKLIENMW